ncbi:MAG: putative rane protein [Anaerocolumna sp.]|jgi:hypothetical protein|nr:putative rane protein [Anaerocolumna sp.]
MNQLNLSKWLKFITIAVGIIGFIVFAFLLPLIGKDIINNNKEYSNAYYPWLIFIWSMGIPCYMVLGFFWSICNQIQRNNSFCYTNSKSLTWISRLAIFDTIYCFAGNTILILLRMSHPGIFIGFLFVIFTGIAIAIVSAALSHLVVKASVLQEENELTI